MLSLQACGMLRQLVCFNAACATLVRSAAVSALLMYELPVVGKLKWADRHAEPLIRSKCSSGAERHLAVLVLTCHASSPFLDMHACHWDTFSELHPAL